LAKDGLSTGIATECNGKDPNWILHVMKRESEMMIVTEAMCVNVSMSIR
jgi:hypothetical protein